MFINKDGKVYQHNEIESRISIDNKEDNNKKAKNKSKVSKVKDCIVNLYSYLTPSPIKYPVICFLYIICISSLHTKLIICAVEDLSMMTKLNSSFFGLTLISWSGNIGDTINAAIAAKLNASELLTATILGAQITNLQLCLGVPWIVTILYNYIKSKKKENLSISLGKINAMTLTVPLLFVVLLSMITMALFGLKLNRKSGVVLICVFLVYLIVEFYINI